MEDELRLEAGKLVLFRRNGLWQARIAIGKRRYLWKSLKTSNSAEAKRAGLKLFHQVEFKIEEGLPVQSRSFSDVIDQYIAERQRDHDLGQDAKRGSSIKHTSDSMLRQIKRVSKFWQEYAGKRAVDAIDDKVLRDFIPWRKSYYHQQDHIHHNARLDPTDKTLQFDLMIGKMFIKYAHDQHYRGNKPLPTFTFTPKIKRVRPAFTLGDYTKVTKALRDWIEETDNEHWKASRWLLNDYVITLALSGIRAGEANSLKVRDIETLEDDRERDTLQFRVRGKTGERVVVPRIDVKPVIDNMLKRRNDPKPNEWLFAMPDGGKIITLIDQFNSLLEYAGVTHNSNGEKYTLYSLRHYYAVRAISMDVDIYTIARNMGTSVQMIEQYYGKHATTTARAGILGGKHSPLQGTQEPSSPAQRRQKLEAIRAGKRLVAKRKA